MIISSRLPTGVDLTSYNYKKYEDVSLRGESDTDEPIYSFFESLKDEPLFKEDASGRELALRLTSGFQLKSLEPRLVESLNQPGVSPEQQLASVRALRETARRRVESRSGFFASRSQVEGHARGTFATRNSEDRTARG